MLCSCLLSHKYFPHAQYGILLCMILTWNTICALRRGPSSRCHIYAKQPRGLCYGIFALRSLDSLDNWSLSFYYPLAYIGLLGGRKTHSKSTGVTHDTVLSLRSSPLACVLGTSSHCWRELGRQISLRVHWNVLYRRLKCIIFPQASMTNARSGIKGNLKNMIWM